MNIVQINNENAVKVAELMHDMKPEWWQTFDEAYGQLTNIDESTEYAKMKGYTTLRTGMSSMDFNIDGCKITEIPEAISSLKTDRIDYKWLLDYGFQVIGIHPNAYGNNSHVILFAKEL